jgi:hypothetical protein
MASIHNLSRVGRTALVAWAHGDARKANAVMERLCEDRPLAEIGARHGVPAGTVLRWVDDFRRVMEKLCELEGLTPRDLVQPAGGDAESIGHEHYRTQSAVLLAG